MKRRKLIPLMLTLLLLLQQCMFSAAFASSADLAKLNARITEIERAVSFEERVQPSVVTVARIEAMKSKIAKARSAASDNAAAALTELENAYLEFSNEELFNSKFNEAADSTTWSVVNKNTSVVADDVKGFAAKLDATGAEARMTQDISVNSLSGDELIFNASFMQPTPKNVTAFMQALSDPKKIYGGDTLLFNLFAQANCFLIECKDKDGKDIYSTIGGNSIKGAEIQHGYSANTWYDFSVRVNLVTGRIRVFINGNESLPGTEMYICGNNAQKGSIRMNCRTTLTGPNYITYIADVKVLSNNVKRDAIKAVDAQITNHFAARNGFETTVELPALTGATAVWSSATPKYIYMDEETNTWTVYPTNANVVGKMKAEVTVPYGDTDYYYAKEYSIDIKKPGANADFKLYERDNEITTLDGVTSNVLTAEADLISIGDSWVSLVAAYDGDRLYDVAIGEGNGDNTKISFNNIKLPQDEQGNVKIENTKVKFFLWDALSNIGPYQNVVEYSKKNTKDLSECVISCWGDSLTIGEGKNSVTGANLNRLEESYPAYLAKLTGGTVNNYGIGGETAVTIAARQGGLKVMLSDFTLAADAGSTVTFTGEEFVDENGVEVVPRYPTDPSHGIKVYSGNWNNCYLELADGTRIEGSIIADVNSNVAPRRLNSVTFTRKDAGEALNITADEQVKFISYDATLARNADINIFYIGTNGVWGKSHENADNQDNKVAADLIETIESMIANTKSPADYLVVGLTSGVRADVEAAMTEAFGDRFVNVRSYLANEEVLKELGVAAPTDEDIDRIAKGLVPASLLSGDGVHFNEKGYKGFADCVYSRLVSIYDN